MYTGLRAKVELKDEFEKPIIDLHYRDFKEIPSGWNYIQEKYPDFPNIDTWCGFNRKGFIPFGVLAYMPDDFSEYMPDEETRSIIQIGGHNLRWEFCCSLKNYQNEIEYFVTNILFRISNKIFYCESLYEEYPPLETIQKYSPWNGPEKYKETWHKYAQDWTKHELWQTATPKPA